MGKEKKSLLIQNAVLHLFPPPCHTTSFASPPAVVFLPLLCIVDQGKKKKKGSIS